MRKAPQRLSHHRASDPEYLANFVFRQLHARKHTVLVNGFRQLGRNAIRRWRLLDGNFVQSGLLPIKSLAEHGIGGKIGLAFRQYCIQFVPVF